MTLARRALLTVVIAVAAMAAAEPPERPQGWYAVVDTSYGTFTFRLLVEQAPQTVAHFVAFAEGRMEWVDPYTGEKKKAPYYDGISIHKTIFARRFEAGDPTGTGHGMPPVWVPSEPGPNNFLHPYRVGTTGASMRRRSGVLWFVSIVSEPAMNTSYNCFGEIVEGRDVVERICNARVGPKGVPLEPIVIRHVAIVKSGSPPPIPDPVPYTPEATTIEAKPAL